MVRTPAKQMIAAIGGGFLAGSALVGLPFLLGAKDVASSQAVQQIGWAVPLAAGLVIGGMALVLIGTTEETADDRPGALESVSCASCGNPIISEWRLCPHCGALLECDTAPPGVPSLDEN